MEDEKRFDEKRFDLKKLAVPLAIVLIIGLVAGYFLSSIFFTPALTITEIVRQLERNIARMAPGEDGAVLATIEGDVITRKLFDLQLSLFLESAQQHTQEEIVRMRNSPEFQRRFLRQLVENRVILKAMETDPDFQNSPEMMVFMHLTIADGMQKYYLYRKANDLSVSTNVSQEEIGRAYDQLIRDPQLRENLARLPMSEIELRLRQEIVRQRQLQEVREYLDRVRGRLRIETYDEVFGRVTDSDAADLPFLGQ
jgi:hypothetical protein